MRRPGIGILLVAVLFGGVHRAHAAALSPSADPVTAFITAADSVNRTDGDAGLSAFLKDNSVLVGAGVAKLLEVGFQAGQQGDAAAEKENVDFAKKVAALEETSGGTGIARGLVDTYSKWTKTQRTQRAKAIALEADANAAKGAGDIDKSIALLTQARGLYEKIGDRHAVAVNWGTMGLTHWSTGDYDVVIGDYDKALTARRAVEDRILEGRTLNGLGSAYQQKGDGARAADYYRQAIDLRRKTGDLTGLGTSLTYLGHVYNASGHYVDARKQYEEAFPIVASLNNPSSSVDLLSGIAAMNLSIWRLDDSRETYLQAIELAQENGLAEKEMTLRRGLADTERTQGRFADALDQLAASEALLAAHPNAAEEAFLHIGRGLTYMNMGELEDARVDLLKGAELAETLDDPNPAIFAQINIGYLYREMGAYDRALKAADQARELAEKAANGRAYRDAMALKGEVQFRLARYDESVASWQEALAQDQADGADEIALGDEIAIAGVRAVKGERKEAREALRALGPRARAAELPSVERAVLNTMGHTFEQENPDSAAYYYERALAHLESEGERIGGAEAQTGYLSGKNRYYFEEVARYYASQANAGGPAAAQWTDRAFRTMERAKARGLLDLLRGSIGGRSTPEEGAALDALYSLDPHQADYANQRAALEKKYLDMRRARMDAAVAGISTPHVTGLDDVAQTLPKKTVLFEFALGDSSSLLWVVDRNHRAMYTLPPRTLIETEVRHFRDALAKPGSGDADMLASARTLYQWLLERGAQCLAEAETIVIVPDGALFELPYDALLDATPVAGAPMSSQPFVVRAHATVYVPSAAVYVRLRGETREQKYARDLFAVGNPDFAGLAMDGASPLAPLPFAEKEVAAVGARVKEARRTELTGAGATEAAVKKELRTDSPRVVHLATHGLVDATEPARSSVALAAGNGEDGFFHTLEIISTPTTSDLVVMSACESARGRVSRGEGVVGLSRAFLGAGAESVVASLWSVSDESTADLMSIFYDRMFGKKRPASRALMEARVALLDSEKFSHPFFWSPFVVTGTERSPW